MTPNQTERLKKKITDIKRILTAEKRKFGVRTIRSYSLAKLFGFSGSVGYYEKMGAWWIGGGVQTAWWTDAVNAVHTQTLKQSLGNNSAQVGNTYSIGPLARSDWSNFTTFQLNLYLQVIRDAGSGRVEFRVGFPFTTLSTGQGPTMPLRLEALYQYPLLTRRIPAATRLE